MKPIPTTPDAGPQMPPEADAAHSATVPDDVLLSPKDAATVTSLSLRTLQRLTDTGDGPPRVRLGRRVAYSKSALLAWALRHAE